MLYRLKKRIPWLLLLSALVGPLPQVTADEVCGALPPPAPPGASEAHQRQSVLAMLKASLCKVEEARDRPSVARAGDDKAYWEARVNAVREAIDLIESRTRYPVGLQSRHVATLRERSRQVAQDFSTYENLARELWSMRHLPGSAPPGPGTVYHRLASSGLDPRTEFERLAREARPLPLVPWFVIGKVELIDRGVNEDRIRAERAFIDADDKARSIAKTISEERERFIRAEAEHDEKRRLLAEEMERQRHNAVQTVADGKRLSSELELIARDYQRRSAVLSERLWRDYRPLKRALDDGAQAEGAVATAGRELARIKLLQRIRLSGVSAARFSGTWRHPSSLDAFQSELDKVNAALGAARAASLAAREDWEGATESWRLALAEVEAASGQFSPYLQALAQSVPHFADQVASVLTSRPGGPASVIAGAAYQAVMNVMSPPTIHGADDIVNLGDQDRRNADFHKSVTRHAPDSMVAQNRRLLSAGYLQKQIASGRLNGQQLQEAAQRLAAERKAFNDFNLNNGFKSFAKNYTKDLMKNLLKGTAIDVFNQQVALWIDGGAARALVAATAKATSVLNVRTAARHLLDASLKEAARLSEERRDLLVGEGDAFATTFVIDRNDAFFAEEGYTFSLTANAATADSLRRSARSFSARLGGIPLHRGRTSEQGGGWTVSFDITPEAEAKLAQLHDLEELSLKIIVDARR